MPVLLAVVPHVEGRHCGLLWEDGVEEHGRGVELAARHLEVVGTGRRGLLLGSAVVSSSSPKRPPVAILSSLRSWGWACGGAGGLQALRQCSCRRGNTGRSSRCATSSCREAEGRRAGRTAADPSLCLCPRSRRHKEDPGVGSLPPVCGMRSGALQLYSLSFAHTGRTPDGHSRTKARAVDCALGRWSCTVAPREAPRRNAIPTRTRDSAIATLARRRRCRHQRHRFGCTRAHKHSHAHGYGGTVLHLVHARKDWRAGVAISVGHSRWRPMIRGAIPKYVQRPCVLAMRAGWITACFCEIRTNGCSRAF